MSLLRQIAAVTGMNLRNIPARLGASLVVVAGIGGTVGVLISVLAMSSGLLQAASGSGRSDRAMVLHGGAGSEGSSGLTLADTQLVAGAPGIRNDADGKPILSAEILEQVPLGGKDGRPDFNIILRGVGTEGAALRPEIRLMQGRMFQPGLRELIAGQAAQAQIGTLSVGSRVTLPGGDWTAVGSFTSGSKSHDLELLADATTVAAAFDGDQFNSVTVLLESDGAFDRFRDALVGNPALTVEVERERDYYVRQSQSLSRILKAVAYVIGGIMALGASFGALNAMYSVVGARSREIATLRAIGFGSVVILMSIFVEALLLAALGAACGAAIVWMLFNGSQISQGNGGGSAIVYSLSITPGLILTGVIWACVIGVVGALPPALRAARLPVVAALRAL